MRQFLLFGWSFLLLFKFSQSALFTTDDCHRVFPSAGGTWIDRPPYWIPKCKSHEIHFYGPASIEKCLGGRTVYAIGNSIGRGVIFELLEMLGGASVSRADQKNQCSKLSTKWEDSCHNELAGVKVKFLFILYMDGWNYADRGGFPFIKEGFALNNTTRPNTVYEVIGKKDGRDPEDNCAGQKMRDCYRRFFANATSNDILIFSLGIAYSGNFYDQVDNYAFASGQAIGFRQYVEEFFPGKVFRFTGAPVFEHLAGQTAPFYDIEVKKLWPAWQPRANESIEKAWYTIDQWAINKDRRHLYADFIHYPGPLTRALIYQILSLLCPHLGVRPEEYPSLIGTLVKLKGTNSIEYFIVDPNLTLRPILSSCLPFYLGKSKIKNVTELDVNYTDVFKMGTDFPIETCKEGMYVASAKDKAVYQLSSLQGKHFLTGFDWKNQSSIVTLVPEWVLTAIPSKWSLAEK